MFYLADSRRPPCAAIIGPDKADKASLVPFASKKALPHKISEERSISLVINPLVPSDPRPMLSPIPGLRDPNLTTSLF